MNKIMKLNHLSLSCFLVFMLGACATSSEQEYKTGKSYLHDEAIKQGKTSISGGKLLSAENNKQSSAMTYLSTLEASTNNHNVANDLTTLFSESEFVQITADDLPLKDYLHYVMGELLSVSYILGEKVKSDNKTVTLNLQQDISKRKLFTVSESVLSERGYVIRFDEGIYYIHEAEGGAQGTIAYGYGNNIENVPVSTTDIVQMVPFDFGFQTQLSLVLQSIAKIKVTPDPLHGAFIIRGKRREVIKAIEFIKLMDRPNYKNREIGVYKSTYVSVEEIKTKLTELMKQEGLGVADENKADKAISIVTMERTGTSIFFAPNKKILERINFWVSQIDRPLSGNELQYFYYQPQFSRATDLGDSLSALIGGGSSEIGSSTSATSQNNSANNSSNSTRKKASSNRVAKSAANNQMKLVVDERANALIFHTTGEKYQQLMPMIKRLDVMPKQVILEVLIAEVTLTDEFKQGVEFAFNSGNYGVSTTGAFMGEGFGGLSYLLKGADGQLAINLLQTNSLVNIVSRPSLVVRDGVNASITVGTDIPIIGATTSDPIGGEQQTTAIEYRKTGVELDVLPTINAQGVVIMEINQKISNEVDAGGTSVISPSVFERTIKTEVVAESGQTVILGGLISENRTNKDSKVPFFGDLPFIGGLFRADDDKGDKTELVVLVTPRIIESADEWMDVKSKFSLGFTELIVE